MCISLAAFIGTPASAGPAFDTSTPISFFTNVASRLLASQMNVTRTRIQVYPANQYTPAVHRLLQVTANILDAQNTNFYPTIFRPLFDEDASNNIFICGYQQVTNVSGTTDPQLAPPYDVAQLVNYQGSSPIADRFGPVNVYGVPWVVGAKQGLPNFNQLSILAAAQVVRKLEITRTSTIPKAATYTTNQAYIIGVSNQISVTFWNSYSNAYPRPLTVVVSDHLNMCMTNSYGNGYNDWALHANFFTNYLVNTWPGSAWGTRGTLPPNQTPNANSFLTFNWPLLYQSPLVYNSLSHNFADGTFQPITPQSGQLDQLGLLATNYLQAFILDGGNVIDYVQLCPQTVSGGLNQALADPNYPGASGVFYQWSTNTSPVNSPTPFGVLNQLFISGHPPAPSGTTPANEMPAGGQWSMAPTPMNNVSPAGEAAYFNGFFTPTFQWNGQTYENRQLVMQAPYTPMRTVYVASLLQANDPLVHYLASDLNPQVGALARWANGDSYNGVWEHSDDPIEQPMPIPPVSPVGGRYQPWGNTGQMDGLGGNVDSNPYNVAYKDPLVWGSDYWNFPTGQVWNLSWIGQVHRGTPWQTIYLKSTNILAAFSSPNGLETWMNWTADIETNPLTFFIDPVHLAPVWDWQMVGLLAAMLDTNDLRTQLSVNDRDTNAWAIELNGMAALTNTGVYLPGSTPQFVAMTISSNSSQAAVIANAIQSTRASWPGGIFANIGYVLATPQLSVASPFLNTNVPPSGGRQSYVSGISDQAYEAIPSQLLPMLRVDAVGTMVLTNGEILAQFTGYDGHTYAVQASPDLLHWTGVSTNSPMNGVFDFAIPMTGNMRAQFYRTVLIQ
ncbi:MAG: hypothetical protein ABSH48_17525 [Verrucomicrobiota bacterium]